MAEANPAIGQQIMSSPDNWKTFSVTYGFPELVIPEANSRDKQQFEIEELLLGAPIPPDPQVIQQAEITHAAQTIQATTTGQPSPPPFDPKALAQSLTTPSVPVLELDFHEYEFAKCKEWLSSEARRRANANAIADPEQEAQMDENGDCPGVQNVILHAMAHQKFMAQAAMAAQQAEMAQAALQGGLGGKQPHKGPPAQLAAPPTAQPSAPAPMGATM